MGVAHYSDEEKQSALRLAARLGMSGASRELHVDRKTIARFRDQLPEFWSDLMSAPDAAPQRKTRSAESLEDLADAYVEREFEAIERARDLIPDSEPKELAALIKAMGSSRGLATVGARGHRGEDTQVIEHNINFAALEMAAAAILERAPTPLPLQVENLAESGTQTP